MDKITKSLQKLSAAERKLIKQILAKIAADDLKNLDIKKLKDHSNIFRVRFGSLRVIFRQGKSGKKFVLTIARRNEKTYKI